MSPHCRELSRGGSKRSEQPQRQDPPPEDTPARGTDPGEGLRGAAGGGAGERIITSLHANLTAYTNLMDVH